MSIAFYADKFSTQTTLPLPDTAAAPSHFPLPTSVPTREELAAAARANVYVQAFQEDGMGIWREQRLVENPPCVLVYEMGEVVGDLTSIPAMARHAEKSGDLGRQLGLRALRPYEEVLAYRIGLRRSPTHPRRMRWEQRMGLKSLLSRPDRRAVREAMRRTQAAFIAWAQNHPGLDHRIADAAGMTLAAFWSRVRGRPG